MTVDESALRGLASSVRDADRVVAMTGAGVSTASGIPDFRGPDGLWTRYDTGDFHVSRFRSDPAGFWRDRLELAAELYDGDVEPNAAHEALAELAGAGHLTGLVTQNVDGLHAAAGHEDVVELHGNGRRVVCTDCGRRFDAPPVRERVRAGEVPPTCEECEGVLKPDVVLFGEQLPEGARLRAHSLAQRCDVFLAVGSSLTVEPAAGFPREAATRGATLAVVNLEKTPVSGRADYDLRVDVTEALPRLAELVTE
ncbi:SIR2 family NAD-dependent protein deacylase [Halomarina litorea]|uniref:SIR2 family NAD-dependent protein deacylase n=1 Tax=Halomarina litorea TaxID=2961595 RepID=UPI0020C4EE3F|nr:Sir2 family NAD-dependent protein deacetylase [Halomarina sp. BCD28]